MSPLTELTWAFQNPAIQSYTDLTPSSRIFGLHPSTWMSERTVSSSVSSPQTSHWPLSSGGRLSQEAKWQPQGITVNLKNIHSWRVHKTTWLFHLKKKKKTSLDSLKARATLHTSAVQPNPAWTETDVDVLTHCGWVLERKTKRLGRGLLSFCCIY